MRPLTSAGSAALFSHAITALSLPSAFSEESSSWLRRRDGGSSTNNVTIPAAISVAPSQYWDGNDGPWSSFPLEVGGGSQTQNVRVMVGTAAYNTWTIGPAGCPTGYVADCNNVRGFTYNPASSLTWVPNSNYSVEIESNLDLTTTGVAGFDSVTLGWQGSGGPTVEHSVVFNIFDSKYWIGVFGVNPNPSNFTNLNDPQISFMQSLANNNTIPSRSYGYTAGNQYRFNKVFGSLTLGGYDANRFTGPGAQFGFYEDISRDLLVNIKSISTDSGSPSNLLPGGQIAAYVDSTTPQIWLPTDACSAFESAFGLNWDSDTNLYLINGSLHSSLVEKNPNVTFTLAGINGTVDVVLPYGAFDLNVSEPITANSTYYFPLQRAANDTQYTLGRTFLQEAYIIADYDRSNFTIAPCKWDQNSIGSTDLKSILSPNWTSIADNQASGGGSSSSFPTGAIAGVVVGIVVVIALLGLALFFLRRRKNHTKAIRLAELEAKNPQHGEAKTSQDDAEGKPFISKPMGGELGGGEIHELNAPNKMHAQEMDSPYKMDPNKVGYSEMEDGSYFGPGKGGSHEMEGAGPIFEMEGSGVGELPAHSVARDKK